MEFTRNFTEPIKKQYNTKRKEKKRERENALKKKIKIKKIV